MSVPPDDHPGPSPQTRVVRPGPPLTTPGGAPVNPPLVRASTVLFDSVAAMRDARLRRDTERVFASGARGTPTTFALEDAVSDLEGAHGTRLFPTGLAAIGMVLLSYLRPGDHVLMSDSVYEPARKLVHSFLDPYGIRCSFFAADGSGIEALFEPATRLVYAECPGSLVYEMCDLPRLAALAHAHGALLAADNTWGSGLQYRPLALGADISLMAATKYLSGHSDVMMGTVSTTREAWDALDARCDAFGMTASPDDAWLVLRGMRSLAARLRMHEAHALEVVRWLQARHEVASVFCPALPDHPGHAIWRRDCSCTNGLVSFELRPGIGRDAVERLVDRFSLFGRGASWGGCESLVAWVDLRAARSLADWSARGAVLRLHVGLEDPADLVADLARGFAALDAAT